MRSDVDGFLTIIYPNLLMLTKIYKSESYFPHIYSSYHYAIFDKIESI